MKYASLWATKDVTRIHHRKIFLVFMEMNLRMGINCNPRFLPTIYNNLQTFAKFKVDMHSIYIRAQKDPTLQWKKLPFVATNDVIFKILETWLLERRAPDFVEIEKSTAERKKDETKLCIAQLAKKTRQEATTTEVKTARDAAQKETKQAKAIAVAAA